MPDTPAARQSGRSVLRPAPCLAISTLAFTSFVLAAPPPWVEVGSQHFTVISNAGAKSAQHVAWQFEQIRAVLVEIWPWTVPKQERRFTVFAARNEATLKELGPRYWRGEGFRPVSFGTTSRGRPYVALRVDVKADDRRGQNPFRFPYWIYAASVFSRPFPGAVPPWYIRGLAELVSNTIVTSEQVQIGLPILENVRLLRERVWLPFDKVLAADRSSPLVTEEDAVRLFDAQAWAMVHYLLFGDGRAHVASIDRYNALLLSGTDATTAAREAFGNADELFAGVRRHIGKELFPFVTHNASRAIARESFASRTLTGAESAVVRAEFLAAQGEPDAARALASEARLADPKHPGPFEIDATLLDAAGDRDGARVGLEKAVAAGSKNASVYYRLAQLIWVREASAELNDRIGSLLERSRALDPSHAATLSFLAETRISQDRVPEALDLAREAVGLEPGEAYHRLALASALWRAQKPAEALEAARAALRMADDDTLRRRAESAVQFYQSNQPKS